MKTTTRSTRVTRLFCGLSGRLLHAAALAFGVLALAGCSDRSEETVTSTGVEPPASPALSAPPKQLPAQARVDVEAAFASYERARALLTADETDGVADELKKMAQHLRGAADRLPREGGAWLRDAATKVQAAASSSSLEEARRLFQDVSEVVVALLAQDPSLRGGLQVFECPMVTGFNKWVQPGGALANPYMGTRMAACGTESAWSVEPASAPSTTAPAAGHEGHGHDGEVAYYTCPMHPSVKQHEPGQCPICGMDLTPVTKAELASGQLLVDDLRRQKIGVRTTTVERSALASETRTVGRITFDETRLYDVSLKLSGWVERLHVDQTGQEVKRGQVLFTLYSPELYAAQVDLISAQRAIDAAGDGVSKTLASSAAKKLMLWDISDAQIEELKAKKVPRREMSIVSPARGHVIEKNVVRGSKVNEGVTVYRIADLRRVWVEAEVYEKDLVRVHVGQKARVSLSYLPGRLFEGEVTFVSPVLDPETRTGKVRLELPNEELVLKPNMYADVTLLSKAESALQVPKEAVIYTGRRRLVFVDLGEGKLQPVEVTVGRDSDGNFEVLAGLKEGDVVVTSGNFLLAAESRLKNATKFWHDDETVEPSPPPTAPAHDHGGAR